MTDHQSPMTNHQLSSGFTLIELILSIALIATLTMLSTATYMRFFARNNIEVTSYEIVSLLRQAQNFSQALYQDTSWGLHTQSGQVTLFAGTSFALRDTSFDETYEVPTSISLSGINEVVFSTYNGIPTPTGTITLTNNDTDTINITLNAKGIVSY